MKTHKEEAEPPQMSQVSEIVERALAHVARPEVAEFTIGYSSGPPEKRVRGTTIGIMLALSSSGSPKA
jgi:hypothetical protein